MEGTSTTIEILDFAPDFKEDFKRLNLEWINEYFKLKDSEQTLLENPEEEIIKNGGYVFFARDAGQIVGTAALLRESNKLFEIAYMAVDTKFRGKKIGKSLLKKLMDRAKSEGARQVYLVSSSKLKPAVEMYRAYGFREAPLDPEMSKYDGSDIKMILNLK